MRKILKASHLSYVEDLLITVNENDKIVGAIDKVQAHKTSYLKNAVYPHRAFSLFMFDHENRLILQKRSKLKPAFPQVWSNTCCSHPLFYPQCLSESIHDSIYNGKLFACKRTAEELGAKFYLAPNMLHFAGRYMYKAICNSEWGEHEMDYVYISKVPKPVFVMNTDEVESIEMVSQPKYLSFKQSILDKGEVFSPWYEGIASHLLNEIWDCVKSDTLKDFATKCLHENKIVML
jgi:isopentenyl-diphosphate delta-isomerase